MRSFRNPFFASSLFVIVGATTCSQVLSFSGAVNGLVMTASVGSMVCVNAAEVLAALKRSPPYVAVMS